MFFLHSCHSSGAAIIHIKRIFFTLYPSASESLQIRNLLLPALGLPQILLFPPQSAGSLQKYSTTWLKCLRVLDTVQCVPLLLPESIFKIPSTIPLLLAESEQLPSSCRPSSFTQPSYDRRLISHILKLQILVASAKHINAAISPIMARKSLEPISFLPNYPNFVLNQWMIHNVYF